MDIEVGFKPILVDEKIKQQAAENIRRWLSEPEFALYTPEIKWMIEQGKFSLLLDSFYQITPFGTGGRRGEVGIGPNRINPWTIMSSAQGHSEFLLNKFADAASRGVVIAYDVRKYPDTGIYTDSLPNPVKGITSKELALAASGVYAANGLKVYFFSEIRTTPELSFAIRKLDAVAGVNISASHNPKEDNGKKIYADHGGQLIPPFDQELSDRVAKVREIKTVSIKDAAKKALFKELGTEIDEAYLACTTALAITKKRNVKVVYSSLHGVGMTSVFPTLKRLGFDVVPDELTSTPDGSFPNVMFNIPNPEVEQSFEHTIELAKKVRADLALNTDPDADRIGVCVRVADGSYKYLTGNEIGIVLTQFLLTTLKEKERLTKDSLILTTCVSAELVRFIAAKFGVRINAELLVGFKYISEIIRELDENGHADDFLFGFEESHGFLIGTYTRDKDAAGALVLISELAATLKERGKNICDYLDSIYREYGYHCNYLSSIIMRGAVGFASIQSIQDKLRNSPPKSIAGMNVSNFIDRWSGPRHLSLTDTMSRNVLCFYLQPPTGFKLVKVTIRPSGTEPKTKIYFEVGADALGKDAGNDALLAQKENVRRLLHDIEMDFVLNCFKLIGIDMPSRGLLLSPLLSVEEKLKYFEVEEQIISLAGKPESMAKAMELLKIFGSDPIEKVSPAFEARTGMPLRSFLEN